jgi:hypothetical protein
MGLNDCSGVDTQYIYEVTKLKGEKKSYGGAKINKYSLVTNK